ncbi:hypothetical protein CY34DRAFT_14979 [Suillus luteus UH-Slu-Lm8-n1]|uniref:Uncharacterized protein n=1 Tax=Suillus luteus UH-Slu-Lm8-n1 TaxID=930992 RepID=A0A0D0B3X7_9AGAM|nr:hypothetical protein CY34DRAFT_14979 [Suillus luteus UH-Slu-Lm8-n1]
MPLDPLYAFSVQTLISMEDETMSDLLTSPSNPFKTPTKPPTTPSTSKEDILYTHMAIAEMNHSIISLPPSQ